MTEMTEDADRETGARARQRHTTWVLARLAGCGDPDLSDGPGNCPNCWGKQVATPDAGGPERKCPTCDGKGSVNGSPGARFLRSVEDAVYELADRVGAIDTDTINDDGSVHEIADAAPDVYTHTRWQEFTDLAAWQEDISEYGEIDGDDLERSVAGVALYMIAERLAWALLEELAEEAEEEGEGEPTPDEEDWATDGSEVWNVRLNIDGSPWIDRKVADLGDDYRADLKALMERQGWFPNVWWVDDHGGWELVDWDA